MLPAIIYKNLLNQGFQMNFTSVSGPKMTET